MEKRTGLAAMWKRCFPVAAACLLAVVPAVSLAVTGDIDDDGFTDAQEGARLTARNNSRFSPCTTTVASTYGASRNLCIDRNSKDLFIFWGVLSGTSPVGKFNFETLFDPINRPVAQKGLAIATHKLIPGTTWTTTDRGVVSTTGQKGIYLLESNDTTDPNILGQTGLGSPNLGGGFAKVYSTRIGNLIDTTCTGAVVCQDSTGKTRTSTPSLYDNYIKHVVSHEIAHSLAIRYPLDNTYGEHYPTGQTAAHTVLEQSMYKESANGTVTFYISFDFMDGDGNNILLR